jgi:hypothetical protein
MATSLQIEPDNWYHALVAMSSDGVLQGALWKDGREDNVARFSVATGSFDDGGYVNQPWQALIGYKGEATLRSATMLTIRLPEERVRNLGRTRLPHGNSTHPPEGYL